MIPILFEAGYLSVQSLWASVVIAMLVGSYLSVKRLKRRRVDFTLFIKHSTKFFLSALVLSRVIFFVTHPDTYFPAFDLRTIKSFFSIWDQGFSFWGAILGFGGMMMVQLKKAEEPVWRWLDALSVPFLVALIIVFVGAFLGGHAYGTPSNLPWAIQYESFNVRYTVPVHPIQIYYILALSLGIWAKYKLKQKTHFFETDGNAALFFSTLFFFVAFLLEFLRGDDTLLILGWRASIYLYLALFITSSVFLFRRYKNFKNEPKNTQ